jgi:hypothetical protein
MKSSIARPITSIDVEGWQQIALIRTGGADATVIVELWDHTGSTVPITVAASPNGSVSLTISSTAKSISSFLTAAGATVPSGGPGSGVGLMAPVGGRILVTAASASSVAINTGGSVDGTGSNGIGSVGPSANGPTILNPGDVLTFGRFDE